MNIAMLQPEEFKAIRVISFLDEYTKLKGTIAYIRPYTTDYKNETLDDFDHSMIMWLKSLNLINVEFIYREDILFDCQLPQLSQIYNGGRSINKLSLVCEGDYSDEEVATKGKIDAFCLKLNVFWNTNKHDICPQLNGVMTFDKNKENYYRDVIKTITSL